MVGLRILSVHDDVPGCHGSGKRSSDASGMRDVTKTKPSHQRQTNKAEPAAKQQWR